MTGNDRRNGCQKKPPATNKVRKEVTTATNTRFPHSQHHSHHHTSYHSHTSSVFSQAPDGSHSLPVHGGKSLPYYSVPAAAPSDQLLLQDLALSNQISALVRGRGHPELVFNAIFDFTAEISASQPASKPSRRKSQLLSSGWQRTSQVLKSQVSATRIAKKKYLNTSKITAVLYRSSRCQTPCLI